jgi:hypothetical protein
MVLQNTSDNCTVHALQNCQIRMVIQNKSDKSTVHHALQSFQIRMVLQNKSDNSNGHALKWSNFRLNRVSIILKMFIAETYPFSRKLPGKRKFLRKRKFSQNEISRKFAHFRIIFAFRENGKTRFRFNPIGRYRYL